MPQCPKVSVTQVVFLSGPKLFDRGGITLRHHFECDSF